MSVRLKQPTAVFECSMCPTALVAEWRELADVGWTSDHAGPNHAPIVLCEPCARVIAARREFSPRNARAA